MSLFITKTLGKKDRPVSLIRGGDLDGQFLCVSEDVVDGSEGIQIPPNSRFTFIPEIRNRVAQHIHIVGPSGVGKSTCAQELCDCFPGKRIVVSADEDDDPAIKNVDMRLKAEKDIQDIELDDLQHDKGVMVVFDDIEGVSKDVSKALNVFRRALHERGRKFGICTVNICHRGADGENTRSALGEMTHLVIFPHFSNNQNTRYLLEKYAGLPANFSDLVSGPQWGRRVMIAINDTPQYVIGEHAASIIEHSTLLALSKHSRKILAKRVAKKLEDII